MNGKQLIMNLWSVKGRRKKDVGGFVRIALCTARIARRACDRVFLQEGSLPSDGSGIDPHATLLVVEPVTETGQRRTEREDAIAAIPLFAKEHK